MTEMYELALDGGKDINNRTKALDPLDLGNAGMSMHSLRSWILLN